MSAKSSKSDGGTQGAGKSAPGGKKLVVVESPAKAKTINRYLGADYLVKASMGHVRDLPKSQMGVDVESGFKPTYEPLSGRKKVLTELKQAAKKAPEVYLATDLDREGEAIAWHLAEALKVPRERIRRVIFNEITKNAILDAFAHPAGIDMDKVNAQQARRILDRIVGYELSPLLWRKVARGLSAGRVQTVAVRLIVERERDIDAFTPEEYWRIHAVFTPDLDAADDTAEQWRAFLAQRDEQGKGPTQEQKQRFLDEHNAFSAELIRWKGERFRTDAEGPALEIARALGLEIRDIDRQEDPDAKGPAKNQVTVDGVPGAEAPEYRIAALKRRETKSRPPAPFTTATLQQTASVRLRYSASRTMRIAQQLYEGIELPGEGHVGLITYMRTDSRHLSRDAISQSRELIGRDFGEEYLPEKPNVYTSGKRAQEAHEAIRPTAPAQTPQQLRGTLNDDQYRLYELIWKRAVACQMTPAIWDVTDVDIAVETPAGEGQFKASGRTLKFDGYMRVAGVPRRGDQILPPLEQGARLAPVDLDPTQHFTQPPPRYTEASLVKALEAEGIGRPSTYASIIKTIQDREYVKLLDRSFHPTHLGEVVVDKLVKHFPQVFDVRFTAHMEDELDRVEEHGEDWQKILREFYAPFQEKLETAREEMVHAKAETEPSEYTCESCGKPMVYRFSRTGRYLACTGYPDCKQTHPVDKDGRKIEKVYVDIACPECGAPMVKRRGRYGPFLSCSRYPDCKGVVNLDRKGHVKHPSPPPLEVEIECPKCGANVNLRRGKRGPWMSCSKYPKCRGRVGFKKLDDSVRAELERKLEAHEADHPVPRVTTLTGQDVGDEHTPEPLPADDPRVQEAEADAEQKKQEG